MEFVRTYRTSGLVAQRREATRAAALIEFLIRPYMLLNAPEPCLHWHHQVHVKKHPAREFRTVRLGLITLIRRAPLPLRVDSQLRELGFARQASPFRIPGGRELRDLLRHEARPAITDEHLVSFGDGDVVFVSAETEPVRFLLISGKPIGEPIDWYGPIVMNTREELRIAFGELERNTFVKHRDIAL